MLQSHAVGNIAITSYTFCLVSADFAWRHTHRADPLHSLLERARIISDALKNNIVAGDA